MYKCYCFQILQQRNQVHILLLPDPPAEKAGTCTIASRSSSRESRYRYYCFPILQQRKQVQVLLLPDPPAEKAGTSAIASRSSSREIRYMYYCFPILQEKSRYKCYCFQILQEKRQVQVLLLSDPPGEKAGTSAIASRSSSRDIRYMYYCFPILQEKSRYKCYCFQILQEKKQVHVLLLLDPPAEKTGTCTIASRSSKRKSRYMYYCF